MSKPKKPKQDSIADRLLKALDRDDLTCFYAEVRCIIEEKLAPLGWPSGHVVEAITRHGDGTEKAIGLPAKKAYALLQALQKAEAKPDPVSAIALVLQVWGFVLSVDRWDPARTPPLYETAKALYWEERYRMHEIALAIAKGRASPVNQNTKNSTLSDTFVGGKRMRELLEKNRCLVPTKFENMWPTWRERILSELLRGLSPAPSEEPGSTSGARKLPNGG